MGEEKQHCGVLLADRLVQNRFSRSEELKKPNLSSPGDGARLDDAGGRLRGRSVDGAEFGEEFGIGLVRAAAFLGTVDDPLEEELGADGQRVVFNSRREKRELLDEGYFKDEEPAGGRRAHEEPLKAVPLYHVRDEIDRIVGHVETVVLSGIEHARLRAEKRKRKGRGRAVCARPACA